MPILDTSFLVAAWNRDDAHHAAARQRLTQATRKDLALRINAGALAETSRILRRIAKDQGQDGNHVARQYLETFLRLPGARIDASACEDAWTRYRQATRLSFVDAWVLAQAQSSKDDVWSFDDVH